MSRVKRVIAILSCHWLSENYPDLQWLKTGFRCPSGQMDWEFLLSLDYYHGFIPGYAAAELLRDEADFILRHSPERNCLAATVRWCTKSFSLDIQTINGQLKLKLGSRKFSSLAELIKAFVEMKQPLPIHGNMRIRTPVVRLPWELDDSQVQIKPSSTPALRKSTSATKKTAFGLEPSVFSTPQLGLRKSMDSSGSQLSDFSTISSLKKQMSVSGIGQTSSGFVHFDGVLTLGEVVSSVTVKTCATISSGYQALLFQEGWIQLRYKHPKIVALLGITVRRPPEVPLKLAFEPLQANLHDALTKGHLTMENKLKAMFDLASALEFLMSGYVCVLHRDIAARSCFINVNMDHSITVKLGNFEKAKEAPEGIYRAQEPRIDQIMQRWTAPEIFENATWTLKTEVWSYGVLMWEIFWDGYQPYGNASFSVVLPQLKKGRKLDPTWDQPDKLAYLMGSCLRIDTTGRPDFTRIRTALQDFARSNGIEF